MTKFLSLGAAALALCLLLLPQTANAAPSLDWEGKDQITYQFAQSSFGFDLGVDGMNHGKKAGRNAGHGIAGGVQLAIGIPLTIVGVALLIPAIYLFVSADILAAGGEEGGALLYRIGGVVLLSLALPALIAGIQLIVGGATSLSKIQAGRSIKPTERYAMKERKRVQWGMRVSLAGVPVTH